MDRSASGTLIERSIVIAAERERVWNALTQPEQIRKWFIEIQFERLAVGEMVSFGEVNPEQSGSIATVEPRERFAFCWPAAVGHPALTLVTFLLEEVAEGTRVTVTEQGFEALPDELRKSRYDLNHKGWGMALSDLATYVQAGQEGHDG